MKRKIFITLKWLSGMGILTVFAINFYLDFIAGPESKFRLIPWWVYILTIFCFLFLVLLFEDLKIKNTKEIKIHCKCGEVFTKIFQIDEEITGKRISCPNCQTFITFEEKRGRIYFYPSTEGYPLKIKYWVDYPYNLVGY